MSAIESPTKSLREAQQPVELGQARPKKEFLGYIHSFRGLAILYVVVGHTMWLLNWPDAPGKRTLLASVLTNGTVFFVFIAGYLFQHLSYKFEYRKYLVSKLTNVVCPYIILSLPAIIAKTAVPRPAEMWTGFYELPVLVQISTFYITGLHAVGYYFIPMICLFYLIAPLLLYLDRRRWVYLFLPAFVAVSLLISRGWHPLHNMAHFFSAYLLGMFFSRYRKETLNFAAGTWPVLLGLATTCVALDYYRVWPAINWNFLQKLLLCAFYLWLLARTDHIVGKWLAPFATASFGIYFLHPYVMATMRKGFAFLGYGDSLPSNSLLLLLLLFCLVSGTCLVLVYLGRRLFGSHSRLFIGS